MLPEYDVIVVGAGHAGCEAAAAAANLGSKVLLVTMNLTTIGQMSCNPAMGGIAKGQIIREIDAMGGYAGIVSDNSAIQFRMLNRSKGPAMWSPRTQNNRMVFAAIWRNTLEKNPNIDFWQDRVVELIEKGGKITGVKTRMGLKIFAKCVILSGGTFLNGVIHIGKMKFTGGRIAEPASEGISEQLVKWGFEVGKMKTGTPPRVDLRSLDIGKMIVQDGDSSPEKFSFSNTSYVENQRCCYITYTNRKVHEVLKEGFADSPMFSGRIKGLGPRYCPSIEDKIVRFAERKRHQIFVEPEGRNTVEAYINGFSTSLPQEIQLNALKLIPGFKNVKMFRPGYAIEYDYFPPTQLTNTLETKAISNLYFAGQINGTTGYEEAGGQGLMAGINAHLKISDLLPLVLKRTEAYIGVLIDDLVNKGTNEPYRMFTSRAEHRIMLRQDNADVRLTPISNKIGLASDIRLRNLEIKKEETALITKFIEKESVSPSEINFLLENKKSNPLKQKVKIASVLARPGISIGDFVEALPMFKTFASEFSKDSLKQAEILLKYHGYLIKEKEMADKANKLEYLVLKDDIAYASLTALSMEAREKLEKIKPKTIGQASRISGISPSDISILMVYLGRY